MSPYTDELDAYTSRSSGRPDAGLEQHLGRLDVVHRIDAEIASPALADAGLGRQVKDVGPVGQQRAEVGGLNRRFDEAEARLAARLLQVPLLDRRAGSSR